MIIPVYNVENYIRQCLDSIVIENEPALSRVEVIIVDDGSPDRAGQIADEYAKKYPNIQVIHKKNAGVAAARNTGLERAVGEWVYFVDSDDWLEAGALKLMCDKSYVLSDADVILWDAWQNTGDRQTAWEHFKEEAMWDTNASLQELAAGVLYYPVMAKKTAVPLAAPWDKLYRREFLQKNALCFQEQLKVLDDMIFNYECLSLAKKVVYCKEKIYHYRYVPNSITNSYKPDRVEQDTRVWKFIETYMQDMQMENEVLWQAYYCRVIKSFSICSRLCFFHRKNERSLSEKLDYVRTVLNSEVYQKAFVKVKLTYAEWKLKIVILFVRWKWIRGIYLLHLLQNGWK